MTGTDTGNPEAPRRLVIFDGECALCSRAVSFIRRRERSARYEFLPAAAPETGKILDGYHLRAQARHTLILLRNDRVFVRSSAVLEIARTLKWPWPLVYAARLIPRPLRDAFYDFVARHRNWFFR